VLEVRRDVDLVQKPPGTQDGRKLGLEHLDRDLSAVLQVLGQVDRRHPTAADLPLDGIAVGEDLPESFQLSVHGRDFPRGRRPTGGGAGARPQDAGLISFWKIRRGELLGQ
jgi:hypothetical protein